MTVDLTVILENRPGTLAVMGESLGRVGITIEGVSGSPCESRGVVHILVENPERARHTLEAAGLEVREERPVLVLNIEDRPGEIGRICRRIATAGANIDLIYMSANARLVIGADNLDRARAAVSDL